MAAGAEAPADSGGLEIVLTFDEALDAASVPAGDAFAVTVSAGAQERTAALAATDPVAVAGAQATLTLAAGQEIRPGETVTVSYTKPAGANASPLQDTAATPNETGSFAGLAVATTWRPRPPRRRAGWPRRRAPPRARRC